MITSEGHTIDILQFCLCRLCHWSFDRGFMSENEIRHHSLSFYCKLTTDLRLLTSDIGHIMILEQRPIFPPDDDRHIPDREWSGAASAGSVSGG
jgi:putative restriction endonuclease